MAASPPPDAVSPPASSAAPGAVPALWVLVLAGPAARAALLGALLVAQQAIGAAFGLGAGALAILFGCVVFGSLLAVFVLPPLVRGIGIRRTSMGASLATAGCLGLGMALAPALHAGADTPAGAGAAPALSTVALFAVATATGFFVAVLSPVTQTLLNRATTCDPAARASLQSAWSAGQPVGFVGAAFLGGILVERLGWWTALSVPLAFALVCAVALMDRRVLSGVDAPPEEPGPRYGEVATIVLALVAFEAWSTWGALRSWADPGVLAMLAVTAGVSVLALRQLRRSDRPVVSPEPFAVPGFAAAFVVLLAYQLPTTAEFEVLLLTELDRISSAEIGNRTAIGNIGQVIGTALAAGLMYRGRYRLTLALGFALTLVGLAGYVAYPWHDGFAYVAATRTVAGFGSGLLTPVLFVLALARMPPALHLAAGSWLVIALIGGTEIGLALFDIVLDGVTAVTGSALHGYLAVEGAQLLVAAATAALAAVCVLGGRLAAGPGETVATGRPRP